MRFMGVHLLPPALTERRVGNVTRRSTTSRTGASTKSGELLPHGGRRLAGVRSDGCSVPPSPVQQHHGSSLNRDFAERRRRFVQRDKACRGVAPPRRLKVLIFDSEPIARKRVDPRASAPDLVSEPVAETHSSKTTNAFPRRATVPIATPARTNRGGSEELAIGLVKALEVLLARYPEGSALHVDRDDHAFVGERAISPGGGPQIPGGQLAGAQINPLDVGKSGHTHLPLMHRTAEAFSAWCDSGTTEPKHCVCERNSISRRRRTSRTGLLDWGRPRRLLHMTSADV